MPTRNIRFDFHFIWSHFGAAWTFPYVGAGTLAFVLVGLSRDLAGKLENVPNSKQHSYARGYSRTQTEVKKTRAVNDSFLTIPDRKT